MLAGTHADVHVVVPDGLSIGAAEARELVRVAGRAPSQGRWQVILVEDADRMTEQASNAVLKMIEEPPPRTVVMLCAPSLHPDDVPVTIRSRCRVVALRTPPVGRDRRRAGPPGRRRPRAGRLVGRRRPGGHVGRARRLARDEDARLARKAVLDVPLSLVSLAACLDAADDLVGAAQEEADVATAALDGAETEAVKASLGVGARGPGRRRGQPGRRPAQGARAASRSRAPPGSAATPSTGRWSTSPASTATRWSSTRPPASRRSSTTPTAGPTPRNWPAGSGPRGRCAGSTRCWPAGWRWSRT